jgi:hypothetical protein
LDALRVRLDPPLSQPNVTAMALYRDQMYNLGPTAGGGYELLAPDRSFETALQTETWQQYLYNYGFGGDSDVSENDLFLSGMGPLIAANAGIYDEPTQKRFQLSADRVRIYLFTEMPDELFANLEYADVPDRPVPAKRVGRVLYTFDVFPPE